VRTQQTLQGASDPLLAWTSVCCDEMYYVRQFRDVKVRPDLDDFDFVTHAALTSDDRRILAESRESDGRIAVRGCIVSARSSVAFGRGDTTHSLSLHDSRNFRLPVDARVHVERCDAVGLDDLRERVSMARRLPLRAGGASARCAGTGGWCSSQAVEATCGAADVFRNQALRARR
jgi:hypothetical protein